MATVFGSSQGFQQAQQDPQMQFPTMQQAQLNHQAIQPYQQSLQHTQQSYQQSFQQNRQPVYIPPKTTFRTRNPNCFWALMIIIALIVITIISSFVTYLMIVWQVNKIRNADWDNQYGPDRWDPNKILKYWLGLFIYNYGNICLYHTKIRSFKLLLV